MTMSSQSSDDAARAIDAAIRTIDPRACREAAWTALERGVVPDPRSGGTRDYWTGGELVSPSPQVRGKRRRSA